ncbi:hypothetical protein POTOM_045056 [Populus tomentosa]|uniref:Uncharacterized protein n=1 Tax=Populus tomentosa TaxID=118781 RepID=A0A8X8CDM4_POPTO|nr:hypothetical protein POTOM_045056 [Populus tomentosa]
MDMKFKNFLALLYPLMFPVELNNFKVKLIIFTGWETSEIVDVIHDIKHIMGDVLFRLVLEMVAFRPSRAKFPCCCRLQVCQSHSSWQQWLPRLQSNTLHGLACELPYSPRRYTAKNFLKFGGARDTDHPEIRQPSALDIRTNLLFA